MATGRNRSVLSEIREVEGVGNRLEPEVKKSIFIEDRELSSQTKAIAFVFMVLFKYVVQKWAESDMCGLKEYFLSQPVHSVLPKADRIKVMYAKNFDEIWKICKKHFTWYDGHFFFLPSLTIAKEFNYIGNGCSEAQAQLDIQVNRMDNMLVSYMKNSKRMVHCNDKAGSPMIIFKLDSEYDEIPDFHMERLEAMVRKVLKIMEVESFSSMKIEFSTIEAAQERCHQSSDHEVKHCSSEADSLRDLPFQIKSFTTSSPENRMHA